MNSTTITAATLTQLRLIRELSALFTTAALRYWLRGGWALDFILGEVTRSHSDIDLVAWQQDAVHIKALLVASGFDFERDVGIQMDFTKVGQDISVVYVAQDDAGRIFTPAIPEWIWLPDSLSLSPHQFDDMSCPVVSPAQLLAEKQAYQQGTGRAPRPKDLRSIEILQFIVG